MGSVFILFRVNEFDEREFWNIFSSEDKAKEWVDKYGKWSDFVYEERTIH